MELSFAQLWEVIEKQKARNSPLMSSGEDTRHLSTVRTGNEMHKDGQPNFWDEFISLCADSEGLGQLLGVNSEKVRSWPPRIQEALEKLEKHTAQDPSEKEKTEVMPTGDNGAFTMNSYPTNLGDAHQ